MRLRKEVRVGVEPDQYLAEEGEVRIGAERDQCLAGEEEARVEAELDQHLAAEEEEQEGGEEQSKEAVEHRLQLARKIPSLDMRSGRRGNSPRGRTRRNMWRRSI